MDNKETQMCCNVIKMFVRHSVKHLLAVTRNMCANHLHLELSKISHQVFKTKYEQLMNNAPCTIVLGFLLGLINTIASGELRVLLCLVTVMCRSYRCGSASFSPSLFHFHKLHLQCCHNRKVVLPNVERFVPPGGNMTV